MVTQSDKAKAANGLGTGFSAAFFGGSGGLILMGVSWPEAPWWMVMGLPLVIMALYFGWGKSRDPRRIHRDVLGDSLYFLGFLFTLASLVSSLIGLLTAPDQDIAANHLLGRFGVALSTTMMGFYLRTVLGQLTPRLDQEEREVQAQIHRHVQNLSYELMVSIDVLKEARLSTKRSIQETSETLGQSLEKALQATGDQIAETLKTSIAGIVEQYSESAKTISGSTATSAESIRESMQSGTERLSSAIADLEKRIRDFEPPQEHVQHKLDDIFEGLTTNIGDLDGRVKEIGSLLTTTLAEFDDFTKSVNGSNRQLARASKSLTTLADASETGATALDKGVAAFAGLDEAMAGAVSGLGTLVERVSTVSEDLAKRQVAAVEARTAEAEAWSTHVGAVAAETARARTQLADVAARDLAEWSRQADAARDQAEAARSTLAGALEQATREYGERLAAIGTEDTRQAREQLVAHVRQMAEDFGETIKRMDEELYALVQQYQHTRAQHWNGHLEPASHG